MEKWITIAFIWYLPILLFGQEDFSFDDSSTAISPQQLIREERLLQAIDSLEQAGALLQERIKKYNGIAWFYLNSLDNYQQAAYYNDKAFVIADLEKFKALHAEALTIKGRILNIRGLFAAAMKNHLKALEIKQSLNDTSKIAFSYQLIGRNLRAQRKHDEALVYFLKSLELRQQLQQTRPKLLQLIGRTYMNKKDYPQAATYFKEALELAEAKKNKKLAASCRSSLADLAYQTGNYQTALGLLEEVLQLRDGKLFNSQKIGIWRELGRNYLALGKPEQAKFYSEKSYTLAQEEAAVGWQVYTLDEVIAANKELGFQSEAIAYLETQRMLKDSIFNLENLRLTTDYQTLYESREKEKQVFEQQEVIAEQQEMKNRMLGVFGLCALFALGGFLLYRNKVQYQHELAAKNAQIQQQKIQELEQQQKILAMSAMIEGQEAERMRIAKDLHDGIGGLLTSVKAHFTAIETELEKLQNFKLYEKTNALIDEACVEVRRISHNMMPHALTLSGLGGALEGIATQLETQGIHCDLETNDDLQALDETKAVMIYRILQELVNNIQKHAEASNVLLQVLAFPDFIQILVEDDGKGFDSEDSEAQKGLGLKSIASRVNYLNGRLQYDSVLGTGTTVSIEIPIQME